MPHFALRFADSHTAARYPLPCTGGLVFRRSGCHRETEVELPALPPDWILTASFTTCGAPAPDFQFRLVTGAAAWPLLPVPSTSGERPDRATMDPAVSVHIDCWHTHQRLDAPRIRLALALDTPPARYLLCISARPLQLTPDVPPPVTLLARPPRCISQMTAAPALCRHICSPTSVAMLLPAATRDELAAAVQDVATGLYGSWPMAVRAAAARGAIAGVELHADWHGALHVLRCGHAFAASIRYGDGELKDAPLPATGGHLVVVHGVDGNRVLVHDPAASGDDSVARSYDATEFSHAWLAMRGASYIIAP